MKNFFIHFFRYTLRGLLAIIPLYLCYLAIWFIRKFIDKQILEHLPSFIDKHQIPGLGIFLLLLCLYFVGLIFSNVLGRQVLKFIHSVADRIPIINFIYGVGKQLSDTLSDAGSQKQAFKKAILVNTFNGNGWMLGLVVGNIKDHDGEELLKIFVPSAPHPLTGIIFIVKPSQTMECGWSVEEALKMVVSIGIISPDGLRKK